MSKEERQTTMQRPYLLRAMHEWMLDNGLTPHIVVDASRGDLNVAPEHVKDGKLVLNVSHTATRRLAITNDRVEFEARFGGTPRWIEIPVQAVLGIYARETGQGMLFSTEEAPPKHEARTGQPDPEEGTQAQRPSSDRSFLKIVK